MKKSISPSVIRRLPRYLRLLDDLARKGEKYTSSKRLSEISGQTASQIRQDFSNFGEFGRRGYGYDIQSLRKQISEILGMNRGFHVIVIGTGNIGRTLIDKFSFNDWGFHLCCAFDVNPALIGTNHNGVDILDVEIIEQYLEANRVDIAVLSVPKTEAIPMAQRLIDCGVDAIWNFTNVEITEPYSQTIVENLHFSDSLMALSFYLSQRRDEQ